MKLGFASAVALIGALGVAGCRNQTDSTRAGTKANGVFGATKFDAAGEGGARAAVIAFNEAVKRGDMDAARKLSFGGDASYQMQAAISEAWKAVEALRRYLPTDILISKREREMIQTAGFTSDVRGLVDASQVHFGGGGAIVMPPAAFRGESGDTPTHLAWRNGRWLVDLDATVAAKDPKKELAEWIKLAHYFQMMNPEHAAATSKQFFVNPLVTGIFYSDDDGKTWFADKMGLIPPFDHNGEPAVIAKIYACKGFTACGVFCAYLESVSPEDHKAIVVMEKELLAKNPSGLGVVMPEQYFDKVLVKRPGETAWHKFGDPEGLKIVNVTCPDGAGQPVPVLPMLTSRPAE